MTTTTVTVLLEVPEPLHDCLRDYLQQHPDWDQEQVLTAALALFLLQTPGDRSDDRASQRHASRIYLDILFRNRKEKPHA